MNYLRPELIELKTWLTLPPSSVRIPMTTIAISTRISAYSTKPCPSSLAKKLRIIGMPSYNGLLLGTIAYYHNAKGRHMDSLCERSCCRLRTLVVRMAVLFYFFAARVGVRPPEQQLQRSCVAAAGNRSASPKI